MNCRHGNVKRISASSLRDDPARDESLAQFQDIVCDVQQGQVLNDTHSLCRKFRVASRNFVAYELRDVEIECSRLRPPPLGGDLLMRCNQQIATGHRDQIAWNR